jgi:Na+/melibiose symporter-like transporter
MFVLIIAYLANAACSSKAARRVRQTSEMPSILDLLLGIGLDDDVRNQNYTGNGTFDDPYIIDFLHNDRQDAMKFSRARKWTIAISQSLSTFALTFASSVYVSGIPSIMQRFDVSAEAGTLGLSLYVVGFAFGPLIWAPLSELYGRKSIYVLSYTGYVVFSVAAIFSPNIAALLIFRFFASAFGSSTLSNTGGIIADTFSKTERGLVTAVFSTMPFLGPALGELWTSFSCPDMCTC